MPTLLKIQEHAGNSINGLIISFQTLFFVENEISSSTKLPLVQEE